MYNTIDIQSHLLSLQFQDIDELQRYAYFAFDEIIDENVAGCLLFVEICDYYYTEGDL